MPSDDEFADTSSAHPQGDDALTAAFWLARQEAESWSRVYEHLRWNAVMESRDAGLSYGQIAAKRELSKPMVTRLLMTDVPPMAKPGWSEAEQRRFDDTWIAAGNPAIASPVGQLRHGLIDDDEYRRLETQQDRAHKPIPQQLHDAVSAHPGLTARELLPHMTVAVHSPATISFAHHAKDADVAVDGTGRYWPTVEPNHLRPGQSLPRHFASPHGGEWATIEHIDTDFDGTVSQIRIVLPDGLRSTFQPLNGTRYPVDQL